ncbi:MAG: hypothetical protein RIS36_2383 [Pseudomonadota bacterium]
MGRGVFKRGMKLTWFVLPLALGMIESAFANPVSFKGGYGVMPAYNKDWFDVQLNYSISNRYAVGVSSSYREGKDSTAEFGIGQFNYLIKRWNELDSQANVNASVGVGGRHDSIKDNAVAVYGALEADYETRRIYSQVSAETLQSDDNVQFSRYRGRLGVTPYKAAFDALNTWLVMQVDVMPEMDESTRVTPMVRLFYNNFVLEVGASVGEGTPFVAGAAHF